jgi:putative transposase
MIAFFRHLFGWTVAALRSRQELILENLALRQQLLALHTTRPHRRLSSVHKLFWIALRRLWAGWKRPLVLVSPRTVVAWHRAGFCTGNGSHELNALEAESE